MTELPRRGFLGGLLAAAAAPAPAGIRVGCQTRVYGVPIRDTQKLLSILDDLRATGYQGFETNFASLEASFADPAPLRAEFEKRAVPLIGLHLGARLTQPDQIEKEQAQIERVARAVRGFGGTHLVLSGSGIPTAADGKLDLEILKRKAREFSRAGKICRDLGIRLASHNHPQETERNGEEMIAVLSATDPQLVSLLLDIGYTHLARLDAPAFIKKYGARIDGFHVRDYRGKQEAPMGQGEVDLRGLARALAETRWAGWVILEMNTMRDVPSRDLVAGARAYMKKEMNL
jgi:inosose dehydratase